MPVKKADHHIIMDPYGSPPTLRACCTCGWCSVVASPDPVVAQEAAKAHVAFVESGKP